MREEREGYEGPDWKCVSSGIRMTEHGSSLKKYHPPVIILRATFTGQVIMPHIPIPEVPGDLLGCDPDKRRDPGGGAGRMLVNVSSTSNGSTGARDDEPEVTGEGEAGPASVAKRVSTAFYGSISERSSYKGRLTWTSHPTSLRTRSSLSLAESVVEAVTAHSCSRASCWDISRDMTRY